jgi:MFS family permease
VSEAPAGSDPGASSSIWRDGAFVRLFAAGAVSYIGSFVTRVALPLTAIAVLGAGPLDVAALRSAEFIGWILVGLVAGAWVDRLRRRPVMIVADVGRALLLGTIPLVAVAGVLGLPQLLAVAFLAATLSVFFNTASRAYLPTIVRREQLIGANSALSASASAAEFTGFGLGGFLVQLLTAPIAIAIDAISFLVSAVLLVTIRRPEPPPPPTAAREPVLREVRIGIGVVRASPIVRALALAHATNHVKWGVFGSVYLLFATEVLGLGPAAIGLIAAIGGASSFIGAALAGRVARRLGLGRAMLVAIAGTALGGALVPLAPEGAVALAAAILIAQQLIDDSAGTVWEILETSLTQAIVEPRLLGRVNATVTFVTTVLALLGAVLGGVVGELFGLRAALTLGAAIAGASALFIWFSPVRSMLVVPGVAAAVDAVVLTPEELPIDE